MTIKNYAFPVLVAALFLLAGYYLYGSAGHDDSHITFWASYTLSEFGEILNYNGDRIEQSSSLLLTLLIALLAMVFQADVVTLGYVITYFSGAIALILTWQLGRRFLPNAANIIALILLATSPAFMLWNTSGMESTLAAACLLAFVLCWGDLLSQRTPLHARSLTLASLVTLALLIVRPEMISLLAALVFLFFIWKRFTRTRGDLPILIFYSTLLLSICLLVSWRTYYFDSPMPLPVYAKVSPLDSQKFYFGFLYLLRHGFANPVFILGALAALVYMILHLRKRSTDTGIGTGVQYHLLLSSLIILGYSAFIWLSGGDWMQSGRFLVPILPLTALVLLQNTHLNNSPKLWIVAPLVVVLHLYAHSQVIRKESHGTPFWALYPITPEHAQRYSRFEQYNQEHLRDMDVIDVLDRTIDQLLLKRDEPVTLLSGQSGMVFFYTAQKYFKKVHFYDSRGLVESSLLKCPLMDSVARSSQGLYFDFDGFFAKQPGLQNDCNIPKPDILYDINDMSRQLPQRMGEQSYTLIHKEGGKILKYSNSLPVNALPAVNFVMISNDVMATLGNPTPTITRYHEKPFVAR